MTATLTPPSTPAPERTPRQHQNPRAVQDVRRTLLALLAAAMGVAPLCELITDRGWLLDVFVTMAIVVAPAAFLRLRRPPSAGQIWLGLLLLVPWLTARFVSAHALAGVIPGPGSWHDVGALMTDLHRTTTAQAAPVHSTVAIKLTLCVLMGLVAALVDLVAVVGRRGALGGVPLLVIFTVSGAVPRSPVSWWLFAIAAGGFLILLALDSSDDLHRWGHYVPRSNPLQGRTVATGQRIAVVAIILAVVIPAFVPSDSRNLLANLFHGGGSDGLNTGLGRLGGTGGVDPFVQLKGQLDRPTPVNLFDVTVRPDSSESTTQLFYARTNTLSKFVGTGWELGEPGPQVGIGDNAFATEPDTGSQSFARFDVDVSITNLSSNPPSFALPNAIDGLDSDTKWDVKDELLVDKKIAPGDKYDMSVNQLNPSVQELRAAKVLPGTDLSEWLQLPSVASSVRKLVDQLTAGQTTEYDKAKAINNYFTDGKNGFVYSLSTAPGDSGDELVDFLQKKQGYCQQYAAAMGVMLRLAGVPSRIVLGYTHAVPDADGKFTVTTNDAHSWVEAYFGGVGWVPFDPTPLAGITGGAANDLPWASHATAAATSSGPDVPSISKSVSTGPASTTSSAPSVAAGPGSSGGSSLTGPLIGLGVLAVLALIVLLPLLVRERRRRGRLRRARRGDTDALWAELSDTATDLGYSWSRSRTPRQVAAWLAGPAGGGAESLRELARIVERTRYAPPGPTTEDGPRLIAALSRVREGLRSGRSPRERLRATLLPASLGWSVTRMLGARRRH